MRRQRGERGRGGVGCNFPVGLLQATDMTGTSLLETKWPLPGSPYFTTVQKGLVQARNITSTFLKDSTQTLLCDINDSFYQTLEQSELLVVMMIMLFPFSLAPISGILFNRPRVAGAVLQTPLSLIH